MSSPIYSLDTTIYGNHIIQKINSYMSVVSNIKTSLWCRVLKPKWKQDMSSLQWCHNERHSVSNHQRLECFLNSSFRRRSTKTSKLRVPGLCQGNPPVTDGFPSQRPSSAGNVSSWWRNHVQHSSRQELKCLLRWNWSKWLRTYFLHENRGEHMTRHQSVKTSSTLT